MGYYLLLLVLLSAAAFLVYLDFFWLYFTFSLLVFTFYREELFYLFSKIVEVTSLFDITISADSGLFIYISWRLSSVWVYFYTLHSELGTTELETELGLTTLGFK